MNPPFYRRLEKWFADLAELKSHDPKTYISIVNASIILGIVTGIYISVTIFILFFQNHSLFIF